MKSKCCKASVSEAPIYSTDTPCVAYKTLYIVYICDNCHRPCEIEEEKT